MNLRTVQRIILALAVGVILIALLMMTLHDFSIPLFVLMMAFAAAMVIIQLVLWRCPHCGRHLGRDAYKFCPHCGRKLDDLQ